MSQPPSDLLRRARAGEQAAIDDLLTRCRPVLRRFLTPRVGAKLGRHVSLSDLEQEVLMSGLGQVDRLGEEASLEEFEGLLVQHARWALGNAARRQRLEAEEELAEVGPRSPSRTQGTVTRKDQMRWVAERMAELPEEQQVIVRMRMEGKTFGDIGEQLGLSQEVARRRFIQAAAILRKGG